MDSGSGVATVAELDALVARVKEAQLRFAGYSQAQVDGIFRAAALAAADARIPLARLAVQETGMGVLEDKVIKNHFAAEYIYNAYKDEKTCGVLDADPTFGTLTLAEPVGLICGIVPVTNPTSTTIFKALISLKTRNAIIFSPHPRARRATCEAARLVLQAAVAAGAPEGILGWIGAPSAELSDHIMHHPDVNLILATGMKYPIADYELTPTLAIVDPDLVMDLPPALTAYGGIDAVTHGLETFVSVMANEFCDAQALQALALLARHLPGAYRDGAGDPQAREAVHNAATLAGMAFANAFLGVCHSMAHKLGSEFHMAHGLANALLIANVIRYNATDTPTKQTAFSQYDRPQARRRYALIADHLGLEGGSTGEKVESLIAWVEGLKAVLHIPKSIQAAGVDETAFLARVDRMAEDAFDDQCTGSNPRFPLIAEIRALLVASYYGRAFSEGEGEPEGQP